jgi:hypothetical protein
MANAGSCLCATEGLAVRRYSSHFLPEPEHHASSHAYFDDHCTLLLLCLIPVPDPCCREVINCQTLKENCYLMPKWRSYDFVSITLQEACTAPHCIRQQYEKGTHHPSCELSVDTMLHHRHWFQLLLRGSCNKETMMESDNLVWFYCYCSRPLVVYSNVVVKNTVNELFIHSHDITRLSYI